MHIKGKKLLCWLFNLQTRWYSSFKTVHFLNLTKIYLVCTIIRRQNYWIVLEIKNKIIFISFFLLSLYKYKKNCLIFQKNEKKNVFNKNLTSYLENYIIEYIGNLKIHGKPIIVKLFILKTSKVNIFLILNININIKFPKYSLWKNSLLLYTGVII